MNENLQESWPLLPWSIPSDPVAGSPYWLISSSEASPGQCWNSSWTSSSPSPECSCCPRQPGRSVSEMDSLQWRALGQINIPEIEYCNNMSSHIVVVVVCRQTSIEICMRFAWALQYCVQQSQESHLYEPSRSTIYQDISTVSPVRLNSLLSHQSCPELLSG